jgi:cytochrome c551/c552
MRSARVLVAVFTILSALTSCKSPPKDSGPFPAAARGDAERGKALVAQYECTRCHTVDGVAAPPKDKQCTGCHHDINSGAITATQEQKARWQSKVGELGDVPSLVSTSSRFRAEWIRAFLLHPRDLRPALQPTMPRLNLDETQARDIAAFLSPSDDEPASAASAALAGANPARGRELMDVKGCGLCHQMTGVAAIHPGMLPTGVTVSDMARAIRLAPDLRFTRDRWQPSSLVRWLQDPPKMKADTLMPSMGLAPGEARSIAAYVLLTSLAPVNPPATPVRLAALDRKVTYDEVATRVLRKTCWHCHGEPDFERGDGGPGNSGGFGFKGRGLNLSDYPATFAGYLDDTGQRTSVFTPTADGTPFIVAAMLARQKEEAGEEGAIRGMPLGLPALPPEDVQLVDTWIAQGRPR